MQGLQERHKRLSDQLLQLKSQEDNLEAQLEQVSSNIQRHIGALQLLDAIMQEDAGNKPREAGDKPREAGDEPGEADTPNAN